MIVPLVAKQRQSVELANARLNLWEGSVRSSKTVCSLLAWLMHVRQGPAGNLAMIGRTERTLRRNVIDPLIEMLGRKRCKPNYGDGELMLLGRRIYLAGANNEASVTKIQGLTLAGAYGDEVTTWPESMWSMLLTRLSVEGASLFASMNPAGPTHWMMRDYLGRPSVWLKHDGTVDRSDGADTLDLARFSFNLRDNPSLPDGYVDELGKQFTGLWRKRYIDGLWVLAEGAVFDTFDPTGPHVVADLPRDDSGRVAVSSWVLAVDYGTTNPFVALLIGLGTDRDGTERMYVAREWRWDSRARSRQMTDAEYSAELRTWLDSLTPELGHVTLDRLIVDPSAASFLAQLWRDHWSGIRKADNAVADGIRATSSLLAGRLRIHESCTGLIGEMSGYVWDPKAAERGIEQPLKVGDHGPDALRYGVMGTRRWWRHWLSIGLPEAEAA